MVEIQSVTFEHHREPLGIGESKPRISWRFEGDAKDWIQSSYEIKITGSLDVSSTPKLFHVASSDSVLVPWPTTPLLPKESATVRVRATGGARNQKTSWSNPVTVETGLLSREDWTGTLIAAPRVFAPNKALRPALFRKSFKLEQEISSARLYITSHGVYETHINGERVGDHILAPGWTSYNHRLQYQTFDVKNLLHEGDNAIGVEVGEGWFCTRLGFGGGRRDIYGDQLAVLAQLEVVFEDGMSITINSDDTWHTSFGPIISSEIYDGEVYDASLEVKDWHTPSFYDTSWSSVEPLRFPTSQLICPKGPPVRKMETLSPKNIFRSPTGKTIVDFGQNLVGWIRVRVYGHKAKKIIFTHTEVLEHGECATRPLRNCKATDTLILSGEPIEWEPKFTFHGFQYVQVDGWPEDGPSYDDIEAVVLHTDMDETGTFECSDSMINKLHKNIRWGMKGNFLSIPTDCPQRDERLGWTGDIQIFAPTASFLYNTSGMLAGWLQDLAAEQLNDYNGVPPLVVPNVIKDSTPKTEAAWADAAVITPYDLYTAFGDINILRDQHLSMKTWLSSALPRGPNGLWDPKTHQLGDWLDPAAPPSQPGNGKTDPHLVANTYLVRITDIMASVSQILGLDEDYGKYVQEAELMRIAFQDEYITPAGRLAPDTMTSLSLALSFDLFSSDHHTNYASARLANIVQQSEFKIATGFVGTPLILPALTATGNPQLAYRMLQETKCPSWLFPITMGATTMWERWDSMLPDGSVNSGSMTSFNHYALGSVGAWLHGVVGGISPAEAGWRKVLVKPVPGGEIRWANVGFEGPYGRVGCEWRIEGKLFKVKVTVPPNSSAEVWLPGDDGGREVGSEVYEFKVPYEEPEWPPSAIVDPFATEET